MTEIKQVNVSVCSLSFYFFFSPGRWVGWSRMGSGWALIFEGAGDYVIILKPNGLRQIDIELLIHTSEVTKLERLQEGGWAGRGGGLYCYIIQCRFMSNITNTSTQCMIHEEKERERMGIELNEQREKMNITQLCCWVCCVSVKILRWFLFLFVRTC